MIFHFTLEVIVKQNVIFDVCSIIISFFLAVLGIYSNRQKFNYISLVYKKYPFIMEFILMKNINKTPKTIENVNDDENK